MHVSNLQIAHSINAYEIGAAYIYVALEETPPRRADIGVQRHFSMPFSMEQLKQVDALIKKLACGSDLQS